MKMLNSIFFILALLTGVGAAPSVATYKDAGEGYSVYYPKKWTNQQGAYGETLFTSPDRSVQVRISRWARGGDAKDILRQWALDNLLGTDTSNALKPEEKNKILNEFKRPPEITDVAFGSYLTRERGGEDDYYADCIVLGNTEAYFTVIIHVTYRVKPEFYAQAKQIARSLKIL